MTEQLRGILESDVVKLLLRVFGLIAIPWAVWVSKVAVDSVYFQQVGDRFTTQDAYLLESRIDARMDKLPPQDWRMRIYNMEEIIRDLQKELRSRP